MVWGAGRIREEATVSDTRVPVFLCVVYGQLKDVPSSFRISSVLDVASNC